MCVRRLRRGQSIARARLRCFVRSAPCSTFFMHPTLTSASARRTGTLSIGDTSVLRIGRVGSQGAPASTAYAELMTNEIGMGPARIEIFNPEGWTAVDGLKPPGESFIAWMPLFLDGPVVVTHEGKPFCRVERARPEGPLTYLSAPIVGVIANGMKQHRPYVPCSDPVRYERRRTAAPGLVGHRVFAPGPWCPREVARPGCGLSVRRWAAGSPHGWLFPHRGSRGRDGRQEVRARQGTTDSSRRTRGGRRHHARRLLRPRPR